MDWLAFWITLMCILLLVLKCHILSKHFVHMLYVPSGHFPRKSTKPAETLKGLRLRNYKKNLRKVMETFTRSSF